MRTDNGKNLYICATYYHILISLMKKAVDNSPADIIIDSCVPNAQSIINKLVKHKAFDGILYFDRSLFKEYPANCNKFLRICNEHWFNRTVINNVFDIPIKEYKKVYIFNDRTPMGRFLADMKVHYTLLEDGTNYFTDIRRVNKRVSVQEDVKRMLDPKPPLKRKIARKLNLGYISLGQNKYCDEIVVAKKEDLFIPMNDKVVEDTINNLADKLSKEQKLFIYNVFFDGNNADDLECADKKVLILTCPLRIEAYVKTDREQIDVFKDLAQKYQKEGYKVFFKPHPRDEIDYSQYIDDVVVLEKMFPIEILSFSGKLKFDIAVSYNSSAVFNLPIAEKMEFIGFDELDEKISDLTRENSDDPFAPLDDIDFSVEPAFENDENAISLVLASSKEYMRYTSVLLQSIIENSDNSKNYDIVIFTVAGDEIKKIILSQVMDRPNINVRFCSEVDKLIGGAGFSTFSYLSKETWYRFLIPYVMKSYKKTLWLDCDMIAMADIAEVYDTKLSESDMIAAARCSTSIGAYHDISNPDKKPYIDSMLQLENPDNYVQGGTILFNNDYFRKNLKLSDIIRLGVSQKWQLLDQDVLNVLAQGHAIILEPEWNVLNLTPGREKTFICLPDELKKGYYNSRSNPKIIHFAGQGKPWKKLDLDFASEFWYYARKSPYYEILLDDITKAKVNRLVPKKTSLKARFVRSCKIRTKKLLPMWTARREFVKKIYNKFSKKQLNRIKIFQID